MFHFCGTVFLLYEGRQSQLGSFLEHIIFLSGVMGPVGEAECWINVFQNLRAFCEAVHLVIHWKLVAGTCCCLVLSGTIFSGGVEDLLIHSS